MSVVLRVRAGLVRFLSCATLVLSVAGAGVSREEVVNLVRTDSAPHDMLVRLCDDFGGRLTGSAANARALERLAEELRELGVNPEVVPFQMPGWIREEDRVEMVSPVRRTLRVAALAYSQPHDSFTGPVVNLGQGDEKAFAGTFPADAIGVLDPTIPESIEVVARRAVHHGVRALLQSDRVNGGQLLARTSSFQGEPLPLPAYSITQEEGRWLQRLLERGQIPRLQVSTTSRPEPVSTANLVVRLRGQSEETLIVGAHFDSWDLGQGAIDNGLGIAQLFALAKALRHYDLPRSVDLVWFNGEEQGLWGSRHQAAQLRDRTIVAMINLDMVGVPIAVNALGDADLVPALERWQASREIKLPNGVENANWFGSDHTPYQLAGVRTITFNAPIDPAVVRYYHDMADTVDKVSSELVLDSSAVIADLVLALAHDDELVPARRSEDNTRALFSAPALQRRIRSAGFWRWP